MTFVKQIAGGAAMLIGVGLCAPPAQAGYVVTLTEQGANVVASGSGPIDTAGLSAGCPGCATNAAGIEPNEAALGIGSPGLLDEYSGFTGPASFGNGGLTFASSGSGDPVTIDGAHSALYVPEGYGSGNPLSDSATYDGATFASLGVTPGTYEWTWGDGANQNFTLDIITAAVPEPSALALLALPLSLALLLAGQRRIARSA